MEKISKRKAVFRVEFEIFSSNEESHRAMCSDLMTEFIMMRDKFRYYDISGHPTMIEAIAKCKSARRLVR